MSYRDIALSKIFLQIFDLDLTKVEEAGREDRVRTTVDDTVIEILHLSGAATGDDRDRNGIRDHACDDVIKAALCTVTVKTRQKDLTCAEFLDLLRQLESVQACRLGASGNDDFVAAREFAVIFFTGIFVDALKIGIGTCDTDLPAVSSTNVDGNDDALGTESFAGTAYQFRIFYCGGIQGDLVRARV